MFGLPDFTTFIMISIPAFWILYTVVFMYISRGWDKLDEED